MSALPHQQGVKVNVPIVPQHNVIDEDCPALPFLHFVKVNEQIVPCSSGSIDEDLSALPFLQHVKVNEPIVPVARVGQIHAITDSCLVPTPTACIHTVCMHVGDSRAFSSTRAPFERVFCRQPARS